MTDVFNHPWLSGLFGDADMAALWSPETQLHHLLTFEAAWSQALGHVGRVDLDLATDTAHRIRDFTPDLADLAARTGQDGLPVPALVRQLKQVVDDERAVHHGATSQDVLDSALALTLRETTSLLDARLGSLSIALQSLDGRFVGNPMMGRTRMQAALPITVSDRLRTWSTPLVGHRQRLANVGNGVAQVQIGGATGNRAALGKDADAMAAFIAQKLGLANPPNCWHTTREGVADYAGCLSLITGTLGKMGQDICLMAQQGIDEVTLAGGGGSSAMPHKQNPILAELLVTLARFNATQVSAMHHALIHEQERSGAAWSLEWMILPQMAKATGRALSAAIQLCESIQHLGKPDDGNVA
jgi:3-carboxy-cis,cis-muconate cycloisomerase